ncbi:uncharacterized protein A1O5_10917 [Cladophialophora psammophila CBS 110553]|uniref:Uncharacterized protein n=1 Tax=Cladophialophora psammophila CBS 110553 TaxID=1182543 RepID=W9WMU0_9EURO|nr:uncharacterized protein A1O5_10917 [Cladophialophora psammophila CBS 110553]EXJ65941.1 hypothetical protein A1O5_10917 [Cladophialophora psammophila CBS 110553]
MVGNNQHNINLNNDDDAIGLGIQDVLSGRDRESQWGYEISERAIKIIWTKLEHEEQDRPRELDLPLKALDGMANLDLSEIDGISGLSAYPAKEPVQIVTDYRSRMTLSNMSNCFNKRYLPKLNNIILVSEAEAAARFVIKSTQQVGDLLALRILEKRPWLIDICGHTVWSPKLSELKGEHWDLAKKAFAGETDFNRGRGADDSVQTSFALKQGYCLRQRSDDLREAFDFPCEIPPSWSRAGLAKSSV